MIVGIDWGHNESTYVILSDTGQIVNIDSVRRTTDQISRFAGDIAERAEEAGEELRVGIDRKNCLLVRHLLDEGITVHAINPKSANRARPIFQPDGEKSDGGDAFLHGELVRTSHRNFRPIQSQDEVVVCLRRLLRSRRAKVKERTANIQRLKDLLADRAPGLHSLAENLNHRWIRDLLEEFPLDEDLAAAHGNTINRFVRNHPIGRSTERKLREVAAGQPGELPAREADTWRRQVRSLLRIIEMFSEEIEADEEQIGDLLEGESCARIFRGLYGAGDVTVAAFLVLFGVDREMDRGWREYASHAGVSPVTRESGRQRTVRMRRACDELLRDALTRFAFCTSRKEDCWASGYYERKRAEGKTHYGALRCLAHRWVKVLHAMWRKGERYDEDYHRRRRRRRGGRGGGKASGGRPENRNAVVSGRENRVESGHESGGQGFVPEKPGETESASHGHTQPREPEKAPHNIPL
jgi:hypothetical protein